MISVWGRLYTIKEVTQYNLDSIPAGVRIEVRRSEVSIQTWLSIRRAVSRPDTRRVRTHILHFALFI